MVLTRQNKGQRPSNSRFKLPAIALAFIASLSFVPAGITVVTAPAAHAVTCTNGSENISQPQGVLTTMSVETNQENAKDQTLEAIKKWRQDALNDTSVKWPAGANTTMREYLKEKGISEEDYLNPTWSNEMEHLAIQRAAEASNASIGHNRPDGSAPLTATYNGVQAYAESLAWGTQGFGGTVDMWANGAPNKEKDQWIAGVTEQSVIGHYTTLINPSYKSYGMGYSDKALGYSNSWALQATPIEATNQDPTNWVGTCQFDVTLPSDSLVVSDVTVSVGQTVSAAAALSDAIQEKYPDNQLKGAVTKIDSASLASFDGSNITGLQPGSGTYTYTSGSVSMTGKLSVTGDSATPTRSVTEPVEVSATTDSGVAPSLPATVSVKWSDGTTSEETVSWNTLAKADYTARDGATKSLQAGTLSDGTAVTLNLTINPATPVKASAPDVVTVIGYAPELPQATITWSDGDPTTTTTAIYDDILPSDYAAEGEFEVNGLANVNGQDLLFKLNVSVVDATLTDIADPQTITTESGIAPVLPSTVKATFSNGFQANLAVTWDEIDPASYSAREGGEFIVQGSVKGWDKKVTANVKVNPAVAVSVGQLDDLTTANGVAPKLPETTQVNWSNGDVSEEAITWDAAATDPATFSTPEGGVVTVNGNVQGVNVSVNVTVDPAPASAKKVRNLPKTGASGIDDTALAAGLLMIGVGLILHRKAVK